MSVVVFGAGRQGECLLYALKKLGHEVFAVDQTVSLNVRLIVEDNYLSGLDFQNSHDIVDVLVLRDDVELVISCLPYFLNEKVARECIHHQVPYFGLGGHVGTSKIINAYAVKRNGQVFTDLGLAPGWVNIMAEECYRKVDMIDVVTGVDLLCGGLPSYRFNPPFNYMCTWSTEGLINEYIDDCLLLVDGEIVTQKGMDGLEGAFNADEYECFNTSGGIGTTLELMKNRGVKNCAYKTVRYKGHRDVVKPLLEIVKREVLEELFRANDIIDKVIVAAQAIGKNSTFTIKHEIYGDGYYHEDTGSFTAMQKCTAFPVATVAHMFVNNHCESNFDSTDVRSFDYSHVDYQEFTETLGGLLGEDL